MTRYHGIVKNTNSFPVSSVLPYAIGYKETITIQPGEERMFGLCEDGFKRSVLEGAELEARKGYDGEDILIAVWRV